MSSFSVKDVKEKIAYYSRHNYLFYQELKRIEAADKMDPAELERATREKTMQYIRSAASRSEFYKNRFKGIDLRGPFEEVYPQLPVLYKDEIRGNEKQIATVPLYLLLKAYTSGTSGTPLTLYRSPRSIVRENAYLLSHKIRHGMKIGEPMVSMRGVLDNTTLYRFNKAENTLYLSSYQLSAANIRKYADLLLEHKPHCIHAFSSSVFRLVNLLDEIGVKLNIPLIFTSSETLYPFQREKIETGFSGKVCDSYGNAERSIHLAQCQYGNYHGLSFYGINEFLERGVVSTSLINKAFPLIRYYVDDSFTLMDEACACGRGIGVRSIEGRMDDVVVLADGTHVGRLGVAFQGINHLRYAQIVQEKVSDIRVNIVVAPEFSQDDEKHLLQRLRQRLNLSLGISFHKVEEKDIIKTPSGKFKLVVSRLPKQ